MVDTMIHGLLMIHEIRPTYLEIRPTCLEIQPTCLKDLTHVPDEE